jgi:hypothetical protein
VNTTPLDERLVARVAAAILRELGFGEPPAPPEPELLPDPEICRRFFSCSRSKYWAITKQPGFPVGFAIGRHTLRRVAEVRAWLAEREV